MYSTSLAHVELGRGEDFRIALRVNLASNREEEEIFDQLFVGFWRSDKSKKRKTDHSRSLHPSAKVPTKGLAKSESGSARPSRSPINSRCNHQRWLRSGGSGNDSQGDASVTPTYSLHSVDQSLIGTEGYAPVLEVWRRRFRILTTFCPQSICLACELFVRH